ncbi:MAG: TonB-dependent receptor [Woeseiaceae bacterium]|nr:TonB-dependent receptor [Woeseiaceae bacterium]
MKLTARPESRRGAATIRCVLLAIAAGAMSAPSYSQLLEEIVVTAEKREQNLQEVPISVTAYSGEQLDALGVSDFTEITQQVPALQLNAWSPKLTIFNLRGISQNTFNDNNEGPVAVYVDDAYVGSLNGISGQMFDLERVEVLRGPQGTLFGRNATGGLIHYISRDASDEELNAYIEAEIGDFGRGGLESAVGGSLGENARYRIAGRWMEQDGYIKSVDTIVPGGGPTLFEGSGQDIGGLNGYALRGNLQVDFSDQLTGSFWVKYSRDNEIPTGGYVFENCPFQPPPNDTLCEVDAEGRTITNPGVIDLFGEITDEHVHYNEHPGFMDRKQNSATARFDYEFDNGMTLTSITNIMNNDFSYDEDGDALAIPILTFQTFVDYSQGSEELRLAGETDRSRWQVGFYYLDMEWDGGTSVTGAPGFGQVVVTGRVVDAGGVDTALATANPFNGFEGALSFQDYLIESRNWSVFGQTDIDLTDDLTLTVGARWSQDNKDIDWLLQFTDNFNPVPLTIETEEGFVATRPGVDEVDYGDWAGRVALNYSVSDGTIVFGSINRGIKGGNWSIGGSPNITPDTFQHVEEVLWAYEVGFKTERDTFRLNGTAFFYDYEDYQAFSLAGGGPFIFNSDADAFGGELELFWYPMDGWDIILGASFMESEVDEILGAAAILTGGGAGGTIIRDAELPNAPAFSTNYLFRYNFDVGEGNLAFQFDGVYNDDQFLEVTNGSGSLQESYNVSNLSVTWATERYSVMGYIKNVFDETYLQYSLDLGELGTTSYYAPPMTWGVNLRVSW